MRKEQYKNKHVLVLNERWYYIIMKPGQFITTRIIQQHTLYLFITTQAIPLKTVIIYLLISINLRPFSWPT